MSSNIDITHSGDNRPGVWHLIILWRYHSLMTAKARGWRWSLFFPFSLLRKFVWTAGICIKRPLLKCVFVVIVALFICIYLFIYFKWGRGMFGLGNFFFRVWYNFTQLELLGHYLKESLFPKLICLPNCVINQICKSWPPGLYIAHGHISSFLHIFLTCFLLQCIMWYILLHSWGVALALDHWASSVARGSRNAKVVG